MKRLSYSLVLIFCIITCEAYADEYSLRYIGVVYPELRAPYNSLFESIVSGIKLNNQISVKTLQLSSDTTDEKVSKWAKDNHFDSLVALGKQGLSVSILFPDTTKVIVGAVLPPPYMQVEMSYSGIVLAPAPERLFEWLNKLAPEVKQVSVVYNPDQNTWLIEHAKYSAKAKGILFNALPANDLREAVQIYKRLIETQLGPDHALWLPQDPHTVDQHTTLPLLLKESWNRDFVVFSSNPSDVKRGALFGLYPDNEAMGRSLGKLALELASSKEVKKLPIEPLKDVLIAVNVRTADHLQLNFSKKLLDSFDLTFPASR